MTHKEQIQLIIEEHRLPSTIKVADIFKLYIESFDNDLDLDDFTFIYSNIKPHLTFHGPDTMHPSVEDTPTTTSQDRDGQEETEPLSPARQQIQYWARFSLIAAYPHMIRHATIEEWDKLVDNADAKGRDYTFGELFLEKPEWFTDCQNYALSMAELIAFLEYHSETQCIEDMVAGLNDRTMVDRLYPDSEVVQRMPKSGRSRKS